MADEKQRVIRQEINLEDSVPNVEVSKITDDLTRIFEIGLTGEKKLLEIDEELITRFEKYLEFEKKLDTIRKKVSDVLYKPFFISDALVDTDDYADFEVIVNIGENHKQTTILLYTKEEEGSYKIADITSFKAIAYMCDEKSAHYLGNKGYIDIFSWLMFNFKDCDFDNDDKEITVNLQSN